MKDGAIGLLHPGEMGATVGAAARKRGATVLWASEGRGSQTGERARAARLEDAGTLAALVERSAVILSVCPPHAAVDVARAVAARRFTGVYVDANAIAPASARDIGEIVEQAGARFVDGGIIGPPAREQGTTRLYLSGREAPRVAALFAETPLAAVVVEGPPGAASAVKMAYAAYTKGVSALLIGIRALAIREGVDAALVGEWGRSQPDLPARSEKAVRGSAAKAWRFVGEMEEIAATFAAAGLPDGFHRGAADLYKRLARFKDAPKPPSVEEAAAALLAR